MRCRFPVYVLEKIIGKKSNVKILRLLITSEDREFCLDDIAKLIDMSCGTVYPSLKELVETRIIVGRKAGRSILYKINKNHLLFKKIKELIDVEKQGLLNVAKEFVSNLPKNNITAVILFGSVSRGDFNEKSDIDLLIVYNDEQAKNKVEGFVDEMLEIYDVHIVPIFLTEKEIQKRKKTFDNFITTVIHEGKLLFGEAKWLEK